jgi:hypothetical protein
MSNPPSGLQVSWHPVESDKLKHLFRHEIAGITLDLRVARPTDAIAVSEKCIVDAMAAGVTNAVFGNIRTLDQNRA